MDWVGLGKAFSFVTDVVLQSSGIVNDEGMIGMGRLRAQLTVKYFVEGIRMATRTKLANYYKCRQ